MCCFSCLLLMVFLMLVLVLITTFFPCDMGAFVCCDNILQHFMDASSSTCNSDSDTIYIVLDGVCFICYLCILVMDMMLN